MPPQNLMTPIIPQIKIVEFQQGYAKGWEEGIDYGTKEAMAIIYSAVGLAARRYLGYGKGRIERFVDDVDRVVMECIDGLDAVEMLEKECGYKLHFKGLTGKLMEVDDL